MAADKEAFVDLFPRLVDEIIHGVEQEYPDYDKGAIAWFRRVLEYNCPGGKMNRGLSVLTTFRHLVAPREPTDQEIEQCNILGWCIEWLQAFFLVADDIMDGSVTRRGQPCWYKQENVGTVAINDSFLIEAAIYKLLKKHFKSTPVYVDLLELMLETTYQTELGQLLDLITAPEDQVVLDRFTIEKHTNIVKYKTAFYSFYLPVAMAMLLAGVKDEQAFANAKDILLEMGIFFQVQDDYLDCYGDPKVIGKIGTDIQDNKCGWLVIQALQRATPEQRKILEDNYARKDAACEARVKELYKELNLEKVYKDYEEQHYHKLMGMIDEKAGQLPKAIFTDFAAKIYKRQK
ncbi:uncharacterized protein MONBRDRAFT_6210 [Monosiga brevicollis MX1]|uniref:Farnesyl pyrophosphate synthase n=1 Tax=Monosiga brevicollis TaxID=81824 RepID=A9UT59_MONBE|nr:uncharacterized protein MONBRDRAFT_6210 [Monosiga brevicollis MX1]EDQ91435.1 predicted protein [Monosiga brevicollis MX1]|eukprot:XP_001743857.1 hypothetical protein [Monosiga brevicollis MX1]